MSSAASVSSDARVRLVKLTELLRREHGACEGPCPDSEVIMRRLGLPGLRSATKLLTQAHEAGLIQLGPRLANSRTVRVLPSGAALSRSGAVAPRSPFGRWLAGAPAGDRRTYFVGHLAEARGSADSNRSQGVRAALAEAVEAGKASEYGLVVLVTRRVADGHEYLAVRTRKPVPRA